MSKSVIDAVEALIASEEEINSLRLSLNNINSELRSLNWSLKLKKHEAEKAMDKLKQQIETKSAELEAEQKKRK